MSNSPSSLSAANPASPPPAAKMPGETVRALVTLFLLFHLFGVALALTTNPNALALPSSPTVDIDSPYNSRLFTALKSTPLLAQYMYALWLDTPHDYWLTYGDYTDADHTVEMTLTFPDGHTEQRNFPPADSHGEQRERYEALVRQLAVPFYGDSPDKTLLTKIGEDLLQQSGAKEVQVQIRRHQPLSIDEAKADDPGLHDPNNKRTFVDLYAGTITLNSLGEGEVHDLGEAARDVAPVTGPRGRNRSQSQPTEKPKSPDDTPPSPPGNNGSSKTGSPARKTVLPLPGDFNDVAPSPEKSN